MQRTDSKARINPWCISHAVAFTLLLIATLSSAFPWQPTPWAYAQDTDAQRRWLQIPAAELPFSPPQSIGLDHAGRVWIGAFGGATIIGPDWSRSHMAVAGSEVSVVAITPAPDGSVWLATDTTIGRAAGVRVIWPDNRETEHRATDGLSDDHVRSIAFTPSGDAWIATAGGLSRLTPAGKWGRFTGEVGLIDDDVYALAVDADGYLWVGTYGGLSQLSPEGEWHSYTVSDGLPAQWIRDLAFDAQGNLWCATGVGVGVRRLDGTWKTYTVSDGLPSNVVNAVTTDSFGGTWVGTIAGVGYLSPDGQWLTFDMTSGLLEDDVIDIAIDSRNQPWVVTRAGVSVLMGGLYGPWTSHMETATAAADSSEEIDPIDGTASPSETDHVLARETQPPLDPAAETLPPSPALTPARPRHLPIATLWADRDTSVPPLVAVLFVAIFIISVMACVYLLLRIFRRRRASVEMPLDIVADQFPSPVSGQPEDLPQMVELERGEGRLADQDRGERAVHPAAAAEPAELLQEGMALARQGRRRQAYQRFAAITEAQPEDVEAWLWRAGTTADADEAVHCLQTAVALDPTNERAQEGLDWALKRRSERSGHTSSNPV